ncbi:MAG: NUDIX domain-containing protein [Marinilabiliales bacterium]|nr:NUDIX domain-containing protein [Marinilabiliales bacterium]
MPTPGCLQRGDDGGSARRSVPHENPFAAVVLSHCSLGKSFNKGVVYLYPVKSPRQTIPMIEVAVGIIVDEDRMYIQKRKEEGHLGGLWEFPGGRILPEESFEDALLREVLEETGMSQVRVTKAAGTIRHSCSHLPDPDACIYL